MASNEVLYQIENPVEAALRTQLIAGGITPRMPETFIHAGVVDGLEQTDEPTTPFVRMEVRLGAWDGRFTSEANPREMHYGAELLVEIVTDRNNPQQGHRELVAKARAACVAIDLSAVNTELEHHRLLMCSHQATTHDKDAEVNWNITAIRFNLLIEILESSFE